MASILLVLSTFFIVLLSDKQIFASMAESVGVLGLDIVVSMGMGMGMGIGVFTCSAFFESFDSSDVFNVGWHALKPKKRLSPIVSDNMVFCICSILSINAKNNR